MPISLGTTTITAIYLGTTSIVSAYLGSTQVFGGASAFTPLDLFSTGAQGIWLDPSDLTTMFSDRAGTTPVTTPGTVVGLRLDKSKGLALGAELVTNGDFSSGTTGWSAAGNAGISAVGGRLRIERTDTTNFPRALFNITGLTAGKSYLVTGQTFSNGISCKIDVPGANAVPFSAADRNLSFYFHNGGTTITVEVVFNGGAGAIGAFIEADNISVRELPGNHAVAPTDAARPIYGVEPKGGRRNLLTWTEDFGNAVWAKAGAASITPDDTTAPNGALTADKITGTATFGFGTVVVSPAVVIVSATTYRASCYMKAGTAGWGSLQFGDGGPNAGRLSFNLSTGALGSAQAFGSGWTYVAASGVIENVGSGWYRCSAAFVSGGTSGVISIAAANSDNSASITAGQFNHIWGAQLELGSTATAYQRVTTDYDVTEAGVQTCHYCRYDGSNSSMSTAAIDFTGTDKMSVFAGVRKLGDASAGIIVESSATVEANTGCIILYTNPGVYGAKLRGSLNPTAITTPSAYAPPVSSILTALGDIAADINTLRVDGVQKAQSTADLGTGNFGNYPLFIGRRNNATLPFNGRDYGLVIVGKAASAGEITDTETWLAAKTSGVTI